MFHTWCRRVSDTTVGAASAASACYVSLLKLFAALPGVVVAEFLHCCAGGSRGYISYLRVGVLSFESRVTGFPKALSCECKVLEPPHNATWEKGAEGEAGTMF